MKKVNILVVAIICIAIAGVMIYNNTKADSTQKEESGQINDTPNIDWQEYAQGMELAKTQNKPIFVYFYAEWCTYCKKIKKTTFRNKMVLNYLTDNFISISVDTDKKQEFAAQWSIRGLPTLLFLQSDNSKIRSIPGYINAKQFLYILKYIHTASYDKMSFHEFVETL